MMSTHFLTMGDDAPAQTQEIRGLLDGWTEERPPQHASLTDRGEPATQTGIPGPKRHCAVTAQSVHRIASL